MYNALTPNFYRAPNSNVLQLLSKFCSVKSEIDDLNELKDSPFVKLMNTNKTLTNMLLDRRIGDNLLKYIDLKCKLNRTHVIDITKKFIDNSVEKQNRHIIDDYISNGQMNIRQYLKQINFEIESNTCHHGVIPKEAK